VVSYFNEFSPLKKYQDRTNVARLINSNYLY
jgi:hypothetical protein